MNEVWDGAQAQELIDLCIRLEPTLTEHGEQLVDNSTQLARTEKKMEWGRKALKVVSFLAIVSTFAAIIGIGVAIKANEVSAEANNTADAVQKITEEINFSRATNTKAACIGDNNKTKRIRVAIKTSLFALVKKDADGQPILTDETKALFDLYNRSVDIGLPYRDCSPEGIQIYFLTPETDPAGPGGSG